jgi:hypothetical protein
MTKEQAEDFFGIIYRGKHNLPSQVKPFGNGWSIIHNGAISSFDFNEMTQLVFLAHDRCCRVSAMAGGMKLKLVVWGDRERVGGFSERHPTIDEAMAKWRETHPISEVKI